MQARSLISSSLLGAFLFAGLLQQPSIAEPPIGSQKTAFDEYIAKPDSSYEWKVVGQVTTGKFKTSILRLHSQTWRTEQEVDRPLWEHWLVVTVPPKVTSDKAFLLIGGGSHTSKQPTGPDAVASAIAMASGGIVAELKNVPNQPLVFHNDGESRVEDDLIGYAWSQYLESGDPTWLPRFPMAKAAVRAMDAITEFSASEEGGAHSVTKFVVAGASKRGWTTWMTAVADDRVVAIVPIVIDVLNIDPSLRHHGQAYGFWAEAIGNYYQHRILQRFDHPRLQDLYALVDPFAYRGRLTMPKYIVNGSGDQFFLPDSSQFYFDQLPGEKLIRYVPNADHGLKNTDAPYSIATFYQLVANGKPRPEYSWSFEEDGTIRVTTKSKPSRVSMWQANNPKGRDFRLKTIGAAFKETELSEVEEGVYVAPKVEGKEGWTATFVELTYEVGTSFPLVVTTAVRVTPDILPYKDIDLTKVLYEPELKRGDSSTTGEKAGGK